MKESRNVKSTCSRISSRPAWKGFALAWEIRLYRLHVVQVSRKRNGDEAERREQERMWERRACTIEASFPWTSKQFCVSPWRGVSSRAIMQVNSNRDLSSLFDYSNFHRCRFRATFIFCDISRMYFLSLFVYSKKFFFKELNTLRRSLVEFIREELAASSVAIREEFRVDPFDFVSLVLLIFRDDYC